MRHSWRWLLRGVGSVYAPTVADNLALLGWAKYWAIGRRKKARNVAGLLCSATLTFKRQCDHRRAAGRHMAPAPFLPYSLLFQQLHAAPHTQQP